MRSDSEVVESLAECQLFTGACRAWIGALDALPSRIEETLAKVRRISVEQGELQARCQRIEATLRASLPADLDNLEDANDVRRLILATEELHERERQQPDWNAPGSLFSVIHSLLNLTTLLKVDGIVRAGVTAQEHVLRSGDTRYLVDPIGRVLDALRPGRVAEVRSSADALDLLLASDQTVAAGRQNATAERGTWSIVAVDDSPEWASRVREVVTVLERAHRANIDVGCLICTDAESAGKLLRGERDAGHAVVVVIDLSIPRRNGEPPTPEGGRELLRDVREKLNMPVVVLSTSHDFLELHADAFRHGVSDFLLKANDAPSQLYSVLERIIQSRERWLVEFAEDGSHRVWVNDIEIRLDPVPFTVLYVLAKRFRFAASVARIAAEMKALDVECANVGQAVYELRVVVEQAFRKVGAHIDAGTALVETTTSGGESAYRFVGKLGTPAHPFADSSSARILLVEDDVEMWREPLREILEKRGFDVTACSTVEEAIQAAQTFSPDFVCLDLGLPRVEGEEPDPLAGAELAGVLASSNPETRFVVMSSHIDEDALRIGSLGKFIRPDDLLSKSEGIAGVSAQLILRLWRFEQERRRMTRLATPDLPILPFIVVLIRRDPDGSERVEKVLVRGRSIEMSHNQGRLLRLLIERPGYPVSKEEIIDSIWPLDEADAYDDPESNLRKLVSRLRKEIGENWLGESVDGTARLATTVLKNEGKAGYTLNAQVTVKTPAEYDSECLMHAPAISS